MRTHGEDLPEIRDWQWTGTSGRGSPPATSRCTSPRHEGARRQRRIQQPEARPAGRRRRGHRGHHRRAWQGEGHLEPLAAFLAGCGAGRRGRATGSCTAAPGTPGRSASTTTCVGYLDSISHLAPLHNPRALAGIRAVRRAAARRAGGRLLRHHLPRDAAAGGAHLRGAAGVERAVGAAPVRLPRPLARLRGAPGAPSSSAGRPRTCGSSPATSVPAPRSPPSATGVSWTRPWASPRWPGW